MCRSATADLVAGTGIAAIGVACTARPSRARDLPPAALPLLLGTHRIIEALIRRSGGGAGPATVVRAVPALPLPAWWVPVGVVCAAPPHARRRLLVPLAVAVTTAASLAYCLATRPVTAEIRGRTLGFLLGLASGAARRGLLPCHRRLPVPRRRPTAAAARGPGRLRGGDMRGAVAAGTHLHLVRVRGGVSGRPARVATPPPGIPRIPRTPAAGI
ncbi:hypothetical protein GCM10010446_29720 [Streptomyces enissocaesilis]|uniref:Uncharacterized protein n=1 Tax=Streptomyces enissocaesilis TaxID=332589 RepID=A0ABN3XB54_9ACTN